MPLTTWVTQPKNPFDSFYYYDTDTKAFVRIRLELGRTGGNPDPGVFPKSNRYIGFVDGTDKFKYKELERWTVNDESKIVYRIDAIKSMVLNSAPAKGKKVIDFSIAEDEAHPGYVHHGNPVTEPPYRLPSNSEDQPVTVEMLRTIANSVLGSDDRIIFCGADATPEELGDAIFKVYNEVIS